MSTTSYDFGTNWRSFLEHHLTPERIEEAKRSLCEFLGVDDLRGRSFLDIGCGSGLFSYAAHELGASRVVSFDVNEHSVACCRDLWRRMGEPENWEVREGSILDAAIVAELGTFDVVYSWGVLHHTGAMWEAIANAAALVRAGGLFFIAIYNKADGFGMYSDGRPLPSRFWEIEKRMYNGMPAWGQRAIDAGAAAGMVLGYVITGKNPVRMIRNHKTLRGMSWMVDIRDWLGGYPYEYASVEEVFRFARKELGLSLENLRSTNSLRCNEYLFRRPDP